MQVRDAIFFTYPMVGPHASVRPATGLLNGVEQRCVLIVIGAFDRSFTGGRNWEESEYCVDAQTGLLTTYAPVPGMYVTYDYSSGIRFHGKSIPSGFTITQAGQTVVEAKTMSVTDPPDSKDPMFNPAGLTALGVGRGMNPPLKLRGGMGASNANGAVQLVVLHGNLAGDGRLTEVEILASSDAAFNQTALARASSFARQHSQDQPGATPQSQEMILTFEYPTSGQ